MATPKVKPDNSLNVCEKCGNVMVCRVIFVKKDNSIKKCDIFQCIVCRHWRSRE